MKLEQYVVWKQQWFYGLLIMFQETWNWYCAKKTTLLVLWFSSAFTAKQTKSRKAVYYHNLCVWHHQIIY